MLPSSDNHPDHDYAKRIRDAAAFPRNFNDFSFPVNILPLHAALQVCSMNMK